MPESFSQTGVGERFYVEGLAFEKDPFLVTLTADDSYQDVVAFIRIIVYDKPRWFLLES